MATKSVVKTDKEKVLSLLKTRRTWVPSSTIQNEVGLGTDRRARELREAGLAESKRVGREVQYRYVTSK